MTSAHRSRHHDAGAGHPPDSDTHAAHTRDADSRDGMRAAPIGRRGEQLVVDRVACTGRGICARLLAPAVRSDEWGYPIIVDAYPDRRSVDDAIRLCPARALHRR